MTQTRSKMPSLLDGHPSGPNGTPAGSPGYGSKGGATGKPRDKWAIVKALVSVAVLVFAGMLIMSTIRGQGPDLAGLTSNTVVKSASTGKIYMNFPIPAKRGSPWKNPDTGAEDDLYPVEECWWADKARTTVLPEPEYVIVLNQPGNRATCPKCGNEVRPQNRRPTEEQIEAARQRR